MYNLEIFNKTTQLRKWLEPRYPELLDHLNNRLLTLIGPDYFLFPPYIHTGDVGKIPAGIERLD